MEDARVFGIIGGTPEAPRVAYLKVDAVVEPMVFQTLGPIKPTEVFRFAARCEERRCVHYDGHRCALARRIVEQLDPVVDVLPPCLVRTTCRWFAEEGAEACRRCPQVVTVVPPADERLARAASPDPQAAIPSA
jgi:hypothetical protein